MCPLTPTFDDRPFVDVLFDLIVPYLFAVSKAHYLIHQNLVALATQQEFYYTKRDSHFDIFLLENFLHELTWHQVSDKQDT